MLKSYFQKATTCFSLFVYMVGQALYNMRKYNWF